MLCFDDGLDGTAELEAMKCGGHLPSLTLFGVCTYALHVLQLLPQLQMERCPVVRDGIHFTWTNVERRCDQCRGRNKINLGHFEKNRKQCCCSIFIYNGVPASAIAVAKLCRADASLGFNTVAS